jgi:hypothetical protein
LTVIGPVGADSGAVAFSLAEDTKVQDAALMPWKVTLVPRHEVPEPTKPAPFTVTMVPAGPEAGLNEEILGASTRAPAV